MQATRPGASGANIVLGLCVVCAALTLTITITGPLQHEPGLRAISACLILASLGIVMVVIWRLQKALLFSGLVAKQSGQDALTKQVTAALNASETLFRAVTESVPAGIWTAGPGGLKVYLNRYLPGLLGVAPEQLEHWRWLELVHPDDRVSCEQTVRAAMDQRLGYEATFRMRQADGEFRWFLERGSPRFSRDGIEGYIGTSVDITERKQAVERLIQFSRVVEQGLSSVLVTDLDGTIVYVNPRFTQITGYTAEEVIGQNPRIQKSGETPDEVYRDIWAAISLGGEWRGEICNRKKSGELYWEFASISALRNPSGAITHYLAVKEDITERKQAENERNRYMKQAHRMIDSNILGVLIFDGERISDVNDSFLKMTGYARTDLLGRHWREITPAELHPLAEHAVDEMQRSGTCNPIEKEYFRKDGSRLPVLVGITLLASEAPARAVEFILDLSIQKRSREALRRSEGKFRGFVENAAEGIYECDTDERVIFANRRLADLLGYGVEELVGHHAWELIDDEYLPLVSGKLEARRRGVQEQYELKYRRKDGSALWVIVNASPVYDESGAYTGSLAMMTDLTARKEGEEEIARMNQQLRGLAMELLRTEDQERRRIARELHDSTAQLLTGIALNLNQVRGCAPAESRDWEVLTETIGLAKQCSNEIRTISYGLHPPLLDELGLVTATRVFAEGFGRRSGLDLSVHVQQGFGRLDADMETALFRIIQESILNVHKHSGSPTATIRLERGDGEVRLEVADVGGNRPKGQDGAGQPRRGVGTLGMSERAAHFGGRMDMKCTPDGTTVSVVLPLMKSYEEDPNTDRG